MSRKGTFAYVFEAHNYYVPKLLNKLQQHDIRVKVGLTPFMLAGKKYDYGTYMIPCVCPVFTPSILMWVSLAAF